MLTTAVSEIGMSPSEFWDLSWYEWGLYLLRYENRLKKENAIFETNWDRTRIMWATLVNVNSGKGKSVKPSDLIRLSFDEKEKTPEPGSVIERYKQKFN